VTAADLITAINELNVDDLAPVLVAVVARIAGAKPAPLEAAAPPEHDDELLTVEQTAKRLGKSKSWLYHHHLELSFAVRGIGSAPRFSRKGLEQYIAKRQRHAF
jgi:predicted DNA-binding transcriptional regulator AlpA